MTDETTQQPDPHAPAAAAAPPPRRELRRSRDNRVIAGVCGGIAAFFGVDATLVRIATVLLVFAGGVGILLYAIGWIVMPEEEPGATTAGAAERSDHDHDHATRTALGAILIVVGLAFLLDELDWLDVRYLWPVALILVGLVLLARNQR